MKYKITPLTRHDLPDLSTNYLRFVIKHGTVDDSIVGMIKNELHERTRWRRIPNA